MHELAVIIVAGGLGVRMGLDTPKQFLLLNGRPLLMTTIEAFEGIRQIIVVLPFDHVEQWYELCMKYCFSHVHSVVTGGKERFYSVKNGLEVVEDDIRFIAIHDGVRPYVTRDVILNTLCVAQKEGVAIPVIELTDTIRQLTNDGSIQLKRSVLRAVQTPQIFRRDILESSYEQPFDGVFTDDASVVEKAGYRVTLCQGNTQNIKITYPKDIII